MRTKQARTRSSRPTKPVDAVRRELLENEEVLVVETQYPVGSTVEMHEHRYPHVIYVIEVGTIETTDPAGVPTLHDLLPGETLWTGPQSHSSRNVGRSPVRVVEIEVKKGTFDGKAPKSTATLDFP